MKRLKDFILEAKSAKINGKMVPIGSTIIFKNEYSPSGKSEAKLVEKDKDILYLINIHGVTLRKRMEDVVEVIPLTAAKQKRGLSPAKAKEIKYQIADLEAELQDLMHDMENDPEVIGENGEGGPATDRYGEQMSKIESKIDKLRAKLEDNSEGSVIHKKDFDKIIVGGIKK